MDRSSGNVIFITGRDILAEGKGGLSGYVRLHALAARRLGYRTHVFCVGDRDGSRDTPYGRIHVVRNKMIPARWIRVRRGVSQDGFLSGFLNTFLKTSYTARLHGGCLKSAIRRLVRAEKGPFVIHSFFLWGSVASELRDELASEGIRVKVVNSVFATMRHEIGWKVRGARMIGNRSTLLTTHVEWCWMRFFGLSDERRSLHSPDLLLYNYDSVRRLFEAEHGCVKRIRKITYTTESAMQADSKGEDIPSDPSLMNKIPLLASVSRHDPRKGLDVLIRALALLAVRGVSFQARIGSGGILLPYHSRLAGELGLGDRVEFTGWLEDPGELYRNCDVFVLPSSEEGSGSLSMLESMMHGNCIVASDIDGIPEDVRHGEEAWLVPPVDPVALADALQTLLADEEMRRRLGAAARRRFMERFDPDVFVSELGEVYRKG